MATDELHRGVEARLREVDQQYTANRRAVTTVLAAAATPLTLPDILDADRSLAQSSAYRSLAVLVEAGVVRRLVHGGDHAHYELAEQLTEHHHHLVCDECGIGRRRDAADAGRDHHGPLLRRRCQPARVRRLAARDRHLRPLRRLPLTGRHT